MLPLVLSSKQNKQVIKEEKHGRSHWGKKDKITGVMKIGKEKKAIKEKDWGKGEKHIRQNREVGKKERKKKTNEKIKETQEMFEIL